MASTLYPVDAFDFAKVMIKAMPLEEVQVRILDDINKLVWMAAPWRWTLGSLATVNLASNTQDYTVAIPSDFLYVADSYISDGTAVPKPLHITAALPTTNGVIGYPAMISVTGTPGMNGTMRVFPKPGTLTTPTKVVYSLYKKTAPVLTEETIHTAGVLLMDDEWFWVYEAGVLWMSYLYADDNRAGSATFSSNGQFQYNGQRGIFESALQQMKEREKLPLHDLWRNPPDVKDTSK